MQAKYLFYLHVDIEPQHIHDYIEIHWYIFFLGGLYKRDSTLWKTKYSSMSNVSCKKNLM